MNRFDVALKMALTHEGRGSATADPGGRTDYGISERAHPGAWTDGGITREEASPIYHSHYWLPVQGGQFRDERLALEVFDFAVNAGVNRASLVLQEAYNAIFPDRARLAEDGKIGPKTLGAVNALSGNLATAMYQYYTARRVWFYEGTSYVKTHGWKNRRGWLARVGCGERHAR